VTTETVLRNARVVLQNEVIDGSVLVRDGVIEDISAGAGEVGEDFEGDYLMAGLVELHTDHLEQHFTPRPKNQWDPVPAVLAHDAQMAAAGATTVLDAIRIGSILYDDDAATQNARDMLSAVEHANAAGITRAEHLVHLRCEVAAANCVTAFDAIGESPLLRLVSLMDHTPGQRQYADVGAFRTYMVGKGRVAEHQIEDFMDDLRRIAEEFSDAHRHEIAARATERGLTLAAHDDATAEHVEESAALGVRISEFPTTVVAARAAVDHGQLVVMGAPNIVKGGSQSGNVAAAELLRAGLLDILSSDYVPASPLQAVFRLFGDGSITLPEGSALVSSNPARAIGLDDRGLIATGLRADLIRVRAHTAPVERHPSAAPIPVVRGVWQRGRRVA
jgi:alpha-D-ribose 1-methylphosphonate 5-triphosphate diphosphatase